MNSSKRLNYIDLFAGCGGLSLGLEKAGFFPLYVNELNKDALESYLINRDTTYPHLRTKYNSSDIKDVIKDKSFFKKFFKDIKEDFSIDIEKEPIDLIAGGPPCQGFSGIGIRRSYSVEKNQLPSNHLYQDMAYFVHMIKPKLFLFENVAGLVNSRWTKEGKKGEIFEDVIKTFKNIPNFEIKFKLLFSKDYGVPQNRPRIIIIGINKNYFKNIKEGDDAVATGFLPLPTNDYPHIEEIFSDIIDDNFKYGGETSTYPKPPSNSFQKELRFDPVSNKQLSKHSLTEQQYSKHTDIVVERFKHMIKHNGEIPPELKTKKFAQRLLPKQWGNKGPTITACSLPDDFVHFSQPRSLTVREMARLQTFPDWYKFSGKRTTGGIRRAGNPRESNFEREVPKYTQIGNAVPVKLAYEIGKHFKKILNGS